MKILVVDSGVGGLSVLDSTLQLVSCDFVYLADSRFFPYGTKDKHQLLDRLVQVVGHFGCDLVVLACNSASTLATQLKHRLQLPIVEVITPTCSYVAECAYTNVCLLATDLTVASEMYQSKLNAVGCNVKGINCGELVQYVENGIDGRALDMLLQGLWQGVATSQPQCVILGCTHFGLIRDKIEKIFRGVDIVDCALPTARVVAGCVAKRVEQSRVSYLTTGGTACAERLSLQTERAFECVDI